MRFALGIDALNLINNSGQIAGQVHMHIVPRRTGDQLNLEEWWISKARVAEDKELNELAAKLQI